MPLRDFLINLLTKQTPVKVNGSQGSNLSLETIQLMTGEHITEFYTPKELVALNRNWVFVCNSKTAHTCATIPLKLYYQSNTKPTKTPCIDLETKELKRLQVITKAKTNIVEITEHPLLDLFVKVNDNMNYVDMTSLIFAYQGLIGNCYVEILRDGTNIIGLNPLVSEFITPVATSSVDGRITRYEYKIDKNVRSIPAKDIIQFSNFVPGSNIVGRGELEFCTQAAVRYNSYDAYEIALAKNNARPDGLVFNWKKDLDEKERKELVKNINKQYNGINKSGKPLLTTGEMTVQNLGLAPKDMQYNLGRDWARDEISAVFGVPKALVTTQDINRANAVAALNHYYKFTIFPKMSKFCEKLNEQLVREYDDKLFLWFSEKYATDTNEAAQTAMSAYSAGIIDRNEARDVLGFEPTDDKSDKPEGDTNEQN